jgi:hypothetical protein
MKFAIVGQGYFDRDIRPHAFVIWLHPYSEQNLVLAGERGRVVFDDVRKSGKFQCSISTSKW